ncbi:DNA repair protein RecN [Desulfoluna butyratoxydans]|uniref:DNA repair protein RecN n=1 Tax=Desulfoluna butyratoxydans TaxID=231438 RepID=A0A4U8YIY3_9BACT|nr:DNA repair protein RecN [Desulfoluna butyratoxydans]VFQ43350.1 dna recombination/repair protein recn [Desulfoluna butyratoxydans]
MLTELSIRHFAIIDDLSISFDEGLTVLSGETGAGKSIIINALNLLLGGRASASLVRTGEAAAEVEGHFAVPQGSDTAERLTAMGHDPAEGLLVRRVISATDRHRVYINGRLATMQLLAELTENLASISGQHAHQALLKEELHLLFLDRFAGLMPLRDKVAKAYHALAPLLETLRKKEALKQRQQEQEELLRFQKEELDAAALEPGEDTFLESERVRLRNAESLLRTAGDGVATLYTAEGAVYEQVTQLKKELEKGAGADSGMAPLLSEAEELCYRVEDLSRNLQQYRDGITVDERALDAAEERLDFLNKLKRKYVGASADLSELIDRRQAIETELAALENLEVEMEGLEAAISEARETLHALCLTLSEKRQKAAGKLSSLVEKELKYLEMPRARFHVAVAPLGAESGGTAEGPAGVRMGETGMDRAVFMIAPNVGEAEKPLAKIASGGELSRVVLAVKTILAEGDAVGTVVFDEVDSGIGGGVAEVVGMKIKEIAGHHQVLCITHLPQIAKFGTHHYRIEKQVVAGRTCTSITPLSEEGRVSEMARMLGGVEVTRATLDHAREMLETAG